MRPRLALLVTILFTQPIHAAYLYSLTDIGQTQPLSINNRGEVVGDNFYWSAASGRIAVTGTLFQINNNGVAAGYASLGLPTAFRWTKETGRTFFPPPLGFQGITVGYGINDKDEVVGEMQFSVAVGAEIIERGFLWRADGSFEYLTQDLNFRANNINNSSVVTGAISTDTTQQAAIWSAETGVIPLASSPTPRYNIADRITEDGTVTGTIGGEWFLWTEESGMTFPFPESFMLTDINESKQGVGYLGTDAYYWSEATGIVKLQNLLDESGAGWQLTYATALNDLGHIVGLGKNPSGQTRAFILSPVAVPEASTVLLSGLGLVVLLIAGHRRRTKSGMMRT